MHDTAMHFSERHFLEEFIKNPSKSDQKYFFSKVTISQINTNLYSVPKIIVLKIQLDLTTTNVDVKHMETIVSTEGSDN
jgi:hypothetical protein